MRVSASNASEPGMSKLETDMTLWFWRQTGGALYEELLVVPPKQGDPGQAPRRIDGLIVLGEELRRMPRNSRPDLRGKDVVVVQTKNDRLGMYLMGQTIFSRELVRRRFEPSSVRAVALVRQSDEALQPLLEEFGCEVVVCPLDVCGPRAAKRSP